MRSGYHQIRVRESDQDKFVFSLPIELRKYFELSFSPKHSPAFYTAMMQSLRKEWLLLFADTRHVILFDTVPVTLICNDNIIIHDIC